MQIQNDGFQNGSRLDMINIKSHAFQAYKGLNSKRSVQIVFNQFQKFMFNIIYSTFPPTQCISNSLGWNSTFQLKIRCVKTFEVDPESKYVGFNLQVNELRCCMTIFAPLLLFSPDLNRQISACFCTLTVSLQVSAHQHKNTLVSRYDKYLDNGTCKKYS